MFLRVLTVAMIALGACSRQPRDSANASGPDRPSHDAPPSPPPDAAAALEVELVLAKTSVHPGEPTPAIVQIRNRSPGPAWITGRMTLGYEDSLERDLYLAIRGSDGGPYDGFQTHRVDFKPVPLHESLRRALAPDETRTIHFDLQKWYRLNAPGRFEVRAVYDPRQLPGAAPTIAGRHESPPVVIDVVAP